MEMFSRPFLYKSLLCLFFFQFVFQQQIMSSPQQQQIMASPQQQQQLMSPQQQQTASTPGPSPGGPGQQQQQQQANNNNGNSSAMNTAMNQMMQNNMSTINMPAMNSMMNPMGGMTMNATGFQQSMGHPGMPSNAMPQVCLNSGRFPIVFSSNVCACA